MSVRAEVNRLLVQGIEAARAGQREQAYHLLLDVVERDRHNELAWLWLSTVAEDPNDQRTCLENVLTLNPQNALARQRLAALPADGARSKAVASTTVVCPQCGAGNRDFVRRCSACGYPFFSRCPACGEFNLSDAPACDRCGAPLSPVEEKAPRPSSAAIRAPKTSAPPGTVTLWPVVAFWTGAALLFIGGGVISLFQFVEILLQARGVIQNLSLIQIAWLPVALFFLTFGFTGLRLAWQLAHRRTGGYYGSLVFGLLLVLLAPLSGLVLEPPNYLQVIYAGLIPAAAVLFTLASMASFESSSSRS